jgi:hypothetical protein
MPAAAILSGRCTGKRLAWIEENKVAGDHPYAPYLAAHRPATFGTIKAADGTDLHYMMITPVMEPGKRYPVFTYHYGGPTANVVHKGWQRAGAGDRGQGLYLFRAGQSRLGKPRRRFRQRDLARDGHGRGRRPAGRGRSG